MTGETNNIFAGFSCKDKTGLYRPTTWNMFWLAMKYTQLLMNARITEKLIVQSSNRAMKLAKN
jgi:hypothetical protein